MPQLDTVTFLSQIFWLVIIFGAFYLTVLTDILPSFSRVLKSRLKKLKSNKDAMYSLGDEKGETSSLYDSSLSTGLDGSRDNLLAGLESSDALMNVPGIYFNHTTFPVTGTLFTCTLKTFIKTEIFVINIRCLSFKISGLLAESTLTILPSAGDITVLSMSGVNLLGSLKK